MTSNLSRGDLFQKEGNEKRTLVLIIIQAVTLSCIMIVGTVANGIICNCIVKKRRDLLVTNTFIFNLAATDFFLCILCLPFALVSCITRTWVFGRIVCIASGFILSLLCIASILTLALVAIDRYLAILHPLKYCTLITRRTSFAMVAYVWLQAVICALLPAIGWGKGYVYIEEESICRPEFSSPAHDNGFTVFLFTTCFVVPFSIITFTYVSILWTARKQFRQVHQVNIPSIINVQPPDAQREPSRICGSSIAVVEDITSATNTTRLRVKKIRPRQKARGFKMLLIIVVVFLICWSPHFILIFYTSLRNHRLPIAVRALTTWLTFLNSSCNPFLYGFLNGKFRSSLKKFLGQKLLCCKWKHNEDSQVFHLN